MVGEPSLADRIAALLRGHAQAVAYPPNQTFIGNLSPDDLAVMARPWSAGSPGKQWEAEFSPSKAAGRPVIRSGRPDSLAMSSQGPMGEIVDQETFYGLLLEADILEPPGFEVAPDSRDLLHRRIAERFSRLVGFSARHRAVGNEAMATAAERGRAVELCHGERVIGRLHCDHRARGGEDKNLMTQRLLENLCTKASGTLALYRLLERSDTPPQAIDFIVSCGEQAVGDRYRRSGGGMARATGEMCGCVNASGMDINSFCAAPARALVTAAALVQAGLYDNVAVVAGGSLARLGMALQTSLGAEMPIVDDCLGSMAFLVTADDRESPILRLDPGAVGDVPIGSSTSDRAIYRHLIVDPVRALGLSFADIDKFAPALPDSELMVLAGAGDVASESYRAIAATAVLHRGVATSAISDFIARVSMPGFAPNQGHIALALPYLGHAVSAMRRGELTRVMFVARTDQSFGHISTLSDGVSFTVERNPASRPPATNPASG